MDGAAVIAAYHDLWKVEQSFRMTKGDLRARPVFHHQREAIEAHLTVVFAALAVARHLQDTAGTSIKKSSRPCARHAQRPSRSTASASPSTPTSPKPPARSSSGSDQVTNDWHESGGSPGLQAHGPPGVSLRPDAFGSRCPEASQPHCQVHDSKVSTHCPVSAFSMPTRTQLKLAGSACEDPYPP
jgi:hypothetical protein